MRRAWIFLALLAVCSPSGPPAVSLGLVVAVPDGDSLEIDLGGRIERVRLIGIDCPERGQPYAEQARERTSELTAGRSVLVRGLERDRYDRLLAYVTLPDGRILNRELVAAGLAWWYRSRDSEPELERLEHEARSARRGLWADPHPEPPWEYRRRRRD
jgi:endonuclease YncB( thermonuclease family)